MPVVEPDTFDWSVVFAALSALVALGSLIFAIASGRSASKSAKRAEKASERATAASERLASIQSTMFQNAAWSVERFGDSSYIVTNTSALPAENVTLTHDPLEPHSSRMEWQDQPGVTIEPWSATKFMVFYGLNVSDTIRRDIVVTWTRPGETEIRTWRHPIPLQGTKA